MRARAGTAFIVIACLGCADETGPPNVASIDIVYYGTVFVGHTLQLAATVVDEAGNVLPDRPVIWQSSNEAAVTVTPTGLLEGLAESGAVKITARCEGVSSTVTVESLIDLRGSWRGSTADGVTHYVTLTSNRFCPEAACAEAGHGGWTRPGTGAMYTIGYGSREQGSISFDLWNADDHFHFVGLYASTSMTGKVNGLPIVLARTSGATGSD